MQIVSAMQAFFERKNRQGSLRHFLIESAGSLMESYLVDPASSRVLVSKIKPFMTKYKH